MAVKNITDFRGGYATDVPSELMAENELVKAENCTWKNGITKRKGISLYSSTSFSTDTGMKGGIRAYINNTWYTILAVDDGTNVHFYAGNAATFTVIDAAYHFTTAKNVEFAELLGHVVAVNGTDKPAVIYWDSALVVKNLEAYDIRTREEINWYAGQWDETGSASQFIDDTADAQDAGATDFQLGNTTIEDGFYISCDYTFNKVLFTGAQQAAGAPVAEYMYYSGSDTGWLTLGTLVTTPDWTAAGADRTLEFNLPLAADGSLNWERYDVSEMTTGLEGKFVIRVRFTTAAGGAFSSGHLTLYNTQYLTQILQNERPHLVRTHNSQIYMASDNIVNFSPPYYVTGWREGQEEHFDEGGNKIIDMVSFADTLVVGKVNTLYTWTTTDLMDPVRSRPLTTVGPISGRSMKQIGNVVAFVARDGVYVWDGSSVSKVSKHIQSDIDTYATPNPPAVVWKNEYWVSSPTGSVVLVFDPDTFRFDDMGDGRVSFFKFTNYKVSQFIPCYGANDTGYLLAIVDQAAPYVARCDYGTQDNITAATNIDMRVQTKYSSFGNFQTMHGYKRMKVKVKEVSAHNGERHIVTLYRDDGAAHEHVEITVPKGTGYYSEDIRIPYTIDGKTFSVELRHKAPTLATFIGYAVDVDERSY